MPKGLHLGCCMCCTEGTGKGMVLFQGGFLLLRYFCKPWRDGTDHLVCTPSLVCVQPHCQGSLVPQGHWPRYLLGIPVVQPFLPPFLTRQKFGSSSCHGAVGAPQDSVILCLTFSWVAGETWSTHTHML